MVLSIVTPADAAALAEIYNPYIEHTTISYEFEPVSAEEMARRIERITAAHPWIKAEEDGVLLGYAYGSEYRSRPAYQWDAEVTVYVRQDRRTRGVGYALYTRLLEILREQNYVNLYALIDHPNVASEGLHARCGFTNTAVLPKTGFKNGAWRDLLIMSKRFPLYGAPRAIDPDWRRIFKELERSEQSD